MYNSCLEVPPLPSTKAMRSLLTRLIAHYGEREKVLENWDEEDGLDQYARVFLCHVLESKPFAKHQATPYMLEFINQLLHIHDTNTLWPVFCSLGYVRFIELDLPRSAKTEVKLRQMWLTDLLANFPGQP